MAEEHPPSPSAETNPLLWEIADQVRDDVKGWKKGTSFEVPFYVFTAFNTQK